VSSPAIEQGRAALRDGDAATAQRAFELALAENESGEALEGLGEVLYLQCDYPAAAAYYERAYAAYRRERQSMAAGRAARTVAWITGNVMGEWAVESGWLARARTILEEAGEDGPERGWVLMIRTFSEPDAQATHLMQRRNVAAAFCRPTAAASSRRPGAGARPRPSSSRLHTPTGGCPGAAAPP
jgi:tetratricopeptide (TPR) repeat protein